MLVDDFLSYLANERNYSPATLQEYGDSLRFFEAFCVDNGINPDFTTISSESVRQWMMEMMEQGRSARTVKKKLSALRSFYRFLLINKKVDTDPTGKVKAPKADKTLPYFLKESEMNRLLDDVEFGEGFRGVRDKLIIRMFYSTGIRLSELEGLNIADVDLSAYQLKVTGKRNKQRIIPFGEELAEAIRHYIIVKDNAFPETGAPLFLSKMGHRIKKSDIYETVKKYLSMVTTLKKRSPHVLRHTFATAMLNNHADMEAVKELLGHESLATTEIYTHTTFEELKQVYKLALHRA